MTNTDNTDNNQILYFSISVQYQINEAGLSPQETVSRFKHWEFHNSLLDINL